MNRRERKLTAHYLDQLVPLRDGSHNEVIDYTVSVPMRYAELRARLADGRTTQLLDSRQFRGWLGYGANPTLLFACGDRQVVVATGNRHEQTSEPFIARDGGQLPLHT